ncbi:hypothetical protein AB5I41_02720 [Sphingomonas sp. MMS24-JH45]
MQHTSRLNESIRTHERGGVGIKKEAEDIYRGDIIITIGDRIPWWRVKAWEIVFGLGLWSGRLDEASTFLSEKRIELARPVRSLVPARNREGSM